MECELWPRLYRVVQRVGKDFRRPRIRYSDAVIVLVFLWACLHDRPQIWACDVRNWGSTRLRPIRIPSDSTLSRRLQSVEVKKLMKAIEDHLRSLRDWTLLKIIDGKPLLVGSSSRDPEAKSGWAIGGWGRGYKLHAVWSHAPFPEAWDVRSLNASEVSVAKDLVPKLFGPGYVVGDAEYDATPLYDVCASHHHQLVAPRAKSGQGVGHRYVSPHRLRSLDLIQQPFGRALLTRRTDIERFFGNATSFGSGLGPLPPWIRRIHRVHRWVWGKLVINAMRICLNKQLAL
jgi:Transposase DDE domain